MLQSVSHPGRAIEAMAASRLLGAYPTMESLRWQDRAPPPVFVAPAVVAPAVVAPAATELERRPDAEAHGIVAALERSAEPIVAGLTVFMIGVAAFMAMFAWWVLVVEPSPAITPPAMVTMPLFPPGYQMPDNAADR